MISKLIEARPEDLRNFIEEAAGISKYKERRREPESRIRRTQENLARLTDLREELGRQLERLHRQAQSTEKYQEHKAEERQLKAQLGAVRWRDPERAGRSARAGHRRPGDRLPEALVAEQRGYRCRHRTAARQPSRVVRTASTRCRHASIRSAATSPGSSRASSMASSASASCRTTCAKPNGPARKPNRTSGMTVPCSRPWPRKWPCSHRNRNSSAAAAEEAGIALEQAEQGMQAWQQQWDAFSQQSAEPRRQAEVQQSRIQHLGRAWSACRIASGAYRRRRGQLAADPRTRRSSNSTNRWRSPSWPLEELQLQEQGQAGLTRTIAQELQPGRRTAPGAGRGAAPERAHRFAGGPQQAARSRAGRVGVVARAGPQEQRPHLAEGLRRAGFGAGGGDRAQRGSGRSCWTASTGSPWPASAKGELRLPTRRTRDRQPVRCWTRSAPTPTS